MGGIGSIGSIGKYFTKVNAKRAGRLYLDTIFGTGCEVFEKSIYGSVFNNTDLKWWQIGKKYKQADFSGFWGKMKDATKAMEKHEGGKFVEKLWKSFKDIPSCFVNKTKAGWKAAGLKGTSKLLGGLKGFGKAFMKKMPLIGGIMMLVGHVPNITAAFKDGGFGAGVGEIAKSGAKIGLDMAGFVIGQALIPIPFVGGLIGSLVIGGIGNAILGKGYKEKLEAKQKQATQNMIDSNPYQQYPQYFQQSQMQMAYNWQPPQMSNVMNQQEYAYMMNQLYGPNNSLHQYAWNV